MTLKSKRLFSVGDFAKMSRVSLAMLHNYDKIGLLSPSERGENNYRYYSISQLSEVNLIRTLQELGMSLSKIKSLKKVRTPERTAESLREQIDIIDRRISDWTGARKLLLSLMDTILSAKDVNESAFDIRRLPAEPIVLGGVNSYAEGENGYDALVTFYQAIRGRYPDLELHYPVWGLFSPPNLEAKMAGAVTFPDRYYFYHPSGEDTRPAGLYAAGYTRGGYGQNGELYSRLHDYLSQNGFEICGPAYEEYPLNELCIADESRYLMRVMIQVQEKAK